MNPLKSLASIKILVRNLLHESYDHVRSIRMHVLLYITIRHVTSDTNNIFFGQYSVDILAVRLNFQYSPAVDTSSVKPDLEQSIHRSQRDVVLKWYHLCQVCSGSRK